MNSVQKKLNLKFFCTEFVILLPLPPKHSRKVLKIRVERTGRSRQAAGDMDVA